MPNSSSAQTIIFKMYKLNFEDILEMMNSPCAGFKAKLKVCLKIQKIALFVSIFTQKNAYNVIFLKIHFCDDI